LNRLSSAKKDKYGITQIYQTKSGGLNFVPNWTNRDRKLESTETDTYSTNDKCVARGSKGIFDIDSSSGIMTMSGSTPRYYCYLTHTNVEVTVYAKRGTETSYKSYQGMVIVARSRHKDYKTDYCRARGYYFRLYNDGKACFLKEFIHQPSGCLIYSNKNPCINNFGTGGVKKGKWYGMKFVIQNKGSTVNLKGYVDFDNGKNGGKWKKILDYNDKGNWIADVESDERQCMNKCDYDGNEKWLTSGNSVFLRASYIKNYQWKWLSVREIKPFTSAFTLDDESNNDGLDWTVWIAIIILLLLSVVCVIGGIYYMKRRKRVDVSFDHGDVKQLEMEGTSIPNETTNIGDGGHTLIEDEVDGKEDDDEIEIELDIVNDEDSEEM